MKQRYDELLKVQRLRQSSREERSILDESESDKARVIYSASFRRLQRKTQVFPLEENAAIRSRMTHSLEVAHVGRYLSTKFLTLVRNEHAGLSIDSLGIDGECALAIPNIVETACLLHDVGNPPFGHFGESAISNWFHDYWGSIQSRFCGDDSAEFLARDFKEFDGNPQGFRIIARTGGVDEYGMNLCAAQLASTVKYPVGPSDVGRAGCFSKKAGIFNSEADRWEQITSALDLSPGARFPLAYLMEAADDISYCLSDIEDGIEKGYLRHADFTEALIAGVSSDHAALDVVTKALDKSERLKDLVDPVVLFRADLITYLVEQISKSYCQNHRRIFLGEAVELVEEGSPEFSILKAVRDVVADLLYGRRASHELELTGHAAIVGILKRYERFLSLDREEAASVAAGTKCGKRLDEQVKLFSLLPAKHIASYRRQAAAREISDADEWMARCHLVTDYVSGMTDVFALRTYQMLSGIRL
ncbi:dGTPase [Stenotrophomonas sp.]|uniref:dGTPase n=1 Tax=Stenotrophomonas sp. TaxID=69392 RepID=UPI0029B71BD7|nr:dGTPase [Stenotrophomonas sp.]MDX3934132.1 dGTPase [Stenotrophomonas sp.]